MWKRQILFSTNFIFQLDSNSVRNHTAILKGSSTHPQSMVPISKSSVVHPSQTSMRETRCSILAAQLKMSFTSSYHGGIYVSSISTKRHDWSCLVWSSQRHVIEKAETYLRSPRQTHKELFKEMTKAELLIWNGINCLLARPSMLVYLASWIWANVHCYSEIPIVLV